MKSTFFDRFNRGFLLIFVAAITLCPAIIMAQGRTFTRANIADIIDRAGLQPGDHIKIEELVVFEGTWRWVSAAGDSVLTFQLWREKIMPPVELIYAFSYDALAGHYSLLVRGAIVSSNTHKTRTVEGLPTFRGTDVSDDGVDELGISIKDFPKNKQAAGRFELLRENPDMARWRIMERRGFVVRMPGEVFHEGFSLPNNVVLHRVKDTPPAPEPPPGWEVQ